MDVAMVFKCDKVVTMTLANTEYESFVELSFGSVALFYS